MKSWGSLPGDDPQRDREAAEAELEAAGIDLDPPQPGRRGRRADEPDAHGLPGHSHPHQHSMAGQPPIIGIIGAGAVGTALGVALSRAGWPVHAVASRDATRRERFRSLVEVSRAFVDPEPLVEEVELIILAVPDDVIAPLAGCTAVRR